MEATKNEFKTQAFVLTPVELTRICSIFPNDSDLKIEIICKDGIDRKYPSLEEFLAFEHPPDKQIKELTLRVYSDNLKNHTTVGFKNSEPPHHSLYSFCSGAEEYVFQVSDKLNDRFEAIKPWYWWIAKYGSLSILGIWLTLFVGLYYRQGLFRGGATPANLVSDIKNVPIGALVVVLLIVIVGGMLSYWLLSQLQKLINKTFPMGVFAIGQGTKRYNDKEKMRNGVFIALIINIVAGIVLWYFLG